MTWTSAPLAELPISQHRPLAQQKFVKSSPHSIGSDVQTFSNFRSLELESNSSLHGLELLILCFFFEKS